MSTVKRVTGNAAPRLHADEQMNSYNVSSAKVMVTADLRPHPKNGTLVGTAHLTSEQLCALGGQPDIDMLNLDAIGCTGGFSNIGDVVGVTCKLGTESGSTAVLPTIDRHMHLCGEEGTLTACHFLLPPASGTGDMHATGDAGTIRPAIDVDTQARFDRTTNAIARSVRWDNTNHGSHEVLAGTCTQVGSGSDSRWLIPHNPTASSCAISKLWDQNKTSAEFCRGDYSSKNASTTTDMQGRMCTVVSDKDMQAVSKLLSSKLEPSSAFQHGCTIEFETISGKKGKSIHSEMTSAGFTPTASVNLCLQRQTTPSVIAGKGMPPADLEQYAHPAAHASAWLGESAAPETPALTPVTTEGLLEKVSAMNIKQTTPSTNALMAGTLEGVSGGAAAIEDVVASAN
jgi:hypothetical protein